MKSSDQKHEAAAPVDYTQANHSLWQRIERLLALQSTTVRELTEFIACLRQAELDLEKKNDSITHD